jgi:DNA-binding CsgD family transcriptional regulator
VELGPLSLGAIRRILSDRLALSISRQLLRRIYDATLGNALFALEVGRKLVDEGPPGIGEDLPVPDAVEDLLGLRVDRLPEGVRRLLLSVALSPDLRVGQLDALADTETLDLAVAGGVLILTGDHVRASHPLLAAAVVERADEAELRELHRQLAAAVGDGELEARHRALAAARPDARLAADVSAAAARANERGAPQTAVELADHALRLTPRNDPDRGERILGLARYLELAGEKQRLTDLLVPALTSLSPGEQRVRACLLLASGTVSGNKDIRRYLERALAESTDALSRAAVIAEIAANDAAVRVERIAAAEALALEALSVAGSGRWDVSRAALYALGWARSLRGVPIDDVCDRFQAPASVLYYFAASPERVAGQRLVWRGELSEARAFLLTLLAAADERGEPSSYALLRLHLCELELRAGEWAAAERRLDEWADSSDSELLVWPMYERCRALLATGRGQPEEARRWAAEAMDRVAETGVCWDLLECRRALGTLELLDHDPGKAIDQLRPVWKHTEREGVRDPGAFPVAPDLVEALVETGELEEARVVTARLGELAEEQDHPWGRATAHRCAAVLGLAETYDEQAAEALARSAGELASLGLAPEGARALLSLGRAQRRFRKWGAARETLESAVQAFNELGSPGWAAVARSELARVGARRPAPDGGLTPSERGVAELAARGLANKEIAQEMVVSVKTVEFHLSNTYAKLGIRSRGELANYLGAQDPRAETLGS